MLSIKFGEVDVVNGHLISSYFTLIVRGDDLSGSVKDQAKYGRFLPNFLELVILPLDLIESLAFYLARPHFQPNKWLGAD